MKLPLLVLGLLLVGCRGASAPSGGGDVAAPEAPAPNEPVGEKPKAMRPVPIASASDPAGARPAPDAVPSSQPTTGSRGDGAACSMGAECASGECEGEGCEADQGRCAPKPRACTRDLRMYCGCDGKTFGASGSCPGRTFRHRGKCGTPPG